VAGWRASRANSLEWPGPLRSIWHQSVGLHAPRAWECMTHVSESEEDLGPRGLCSVVADDEPLGPRGLTRQPRPRTALESSVVAAPPPTSTDLVQHRQSLEGWLLPSSELQHTLVGLRSSQNQRQSHMVDEVGRVVEYLLGSEHRGACVPAMAEAKLLDIPVYRSNSTIREIASCMFEACLLYGHSLFKQLASALASGCQPLCALTQVSYDETPLVMRAGGQRGVKKDVYKQVLKVVQVKARASFLMRCGCKSMTLTTAYFDSDSSFRPRKYLPCDF
jgi:hypothetical protein